MARGESKLLSGREARFGFVYGLNGVPPLTNAAQRVSSRRPKARQALFISDLEHLELLQPGPTPSPWRTFLDKNGQGVMHMCLFVGDRIVFQQKLEDIGVGLPYHVGYYPGGSYSYVDSKEYLGLELSVNHQGDYGDLIGDLLSGLRQPLDELR